MRMNTFFAAGVTCGVAFALAVPSTAHAFSARDRIVDRALVECTRGSMLQVDLERERRKLEVDVEVAGSPRERWTITIGRPGRVLHTISRSANGEGEVNAWRYVSARTKSIVVRATSASGETCRAIVRQ